MLDPREAASLPAAYLMGSIPFAYLAVRWIRGVDIRTVGSGNVGATNAGRILGRPAAVAIYVLDAAKGGGAVLTARALAPVPNPMLEVVCGLLAIAGHLFPVWLRFKGGKGVATTTGVFAALTPVAFAISGGVWILTALLTRYVSLASIALGLALPLAVLLVEGDAARGERWPVLALAIAAALFIALRHISNVKRVFQGTEPKIGGVKPAVQPEGSAR